MDALNEEFADGGDGEENEGLARAAGTVARRVLADPTGRTRSAVISALSANRTAVERRLGALEGRLDSMDNTLQAMTGLVRIALAAPEPY